MSTFLPPSTYVRRGGAKRDKQTSTPSASQHISTSRLLGWVSVPRKTVVRCLAHAGACK